MSDDIERQFFERLLAALPESKPVVDEHVDFYEQLLPYVALSEVTTAMFEREKNTLSGDRYRGDDAFRRYVGLLADEFNNDDGRISDIVIQSFIEFVDTLSVTEPAFYAHVVSLLPMRIRSKLTPPSK